MNDYEDDQHRPVSEKTLDVLRETLAAIYHLQTLMEQRLAPRPGAGEYRLTIIVILLAYIAYRLTP